MPHEVTKEDLSAFLDGEIDPEGRSRVEGHLASCKECVSYIERVRKSAAVFKKHGVEDVPAGLLGRALGGASKKKKLPTLVHRFQWAVALAAVVAIVLVSGLAMKKFMPDLFEQIQGMISSAAGNLGN